MTLTATTPRNEYVADGVNDTYAFTFRILDETELLVLLDDIGQTLNVDYTIQNLTNVGGDVVFTTLPANAVDVDLRRQTTIDQQVDYQPFDPFPAGTHELALDKLTAIDQELRLALDRIAAGDIDFSNDQVVTGKWSFTQEIAGATDGNIKPADDVVATGAWAFVAPISGTTTGNLVSSDLAPYTQNAANETITGNWIFNGTVNFRARTFFEAEPRLNNNVALQSINNAATLNVDLLKLTATDQVVLGSSGYQSYIDGSQIFLRHAGIASARTQTRANGSLQIADSAGAFGDVAAVHKNNNFQVNQDFNNNIQVAGQTRIVGGSAATPSLVFTSDQDTGLYRKAAGQMSFSSNGAEEVRFVNRADGSLLIASSDGIYGNVVAVHKDQTFTGVNVFEAQTSLNQSTVLNNNIALFGRNLAAQARTLAFVDTLDRAVFGDTTLAMRLQGSVIEMVDDGETVAQTASRANGSLIAFDRSGRAKEVGFRKPHVRSLAAGGTYVLDQTYEGEVLTVDNVGITIQCEQLDIGTIIRVRTGGIGCSITEGTGVVMRWIDGGGGASGNRTMNVWSFVELVWKDTNEVDIVGNGIV